MITDRGSGRSSHIPDRRFSGAAGPSAGRDRVLAIRRSRSRTRFSIEQSQFVCKLGTYTLRARACALAAPEHVPRGTCTLPTYRLRPISSLNSPSTPFFAPPRSFSFTFHVTIDRLSAKVSSRARPPWLSPSMSPLLSRSPKKSRFSGSRSVLASMSTRLEWKLNSAISKKQPSLKPRPPT